MKRVSVIAGNWKMHKTAREAAEFITALRALIPSTDKRILIAPSFTALEAASRAAAGSPLVIGAQNMHDLPNGAVTGEICAAMLKAAGASFVLLGHSERRTLFGETNAFINRKVKRALAEGLIPLLCIGETLAEREQDKTEEVLSSQLTECLDGIPASTELLIAYEPVWAIGTGRAATAELAQEVHRQCRALVEHKWGKAFAEQLPILYGGSVKPENIASLLAQEDIDGVLVGGAALDVNSFAQLINPSRSL